MYIKNKDLLVENKDITGEPLLSRDIIIDYRKANIKVYSDSIAVLDYGLGEKYYLSCDSKVINDLIEKIRNLRYFLDSYTLREIEDLNLPENYLDGAFLDIQSKERNIHNIPIFVYLTYMNLPFNIGLISSYGLKKVSEKVKKISTLSEIQKISKDIISLYRSDIEKYLCSYIDIELGFENPIDICSISEYKSNNLSNSNKLLSSEYESFNSSFILYESGLIESNGNNYRLSLGTLRRIYESIRKINNSCDFYSSESFDDFDEVPDSCGYRNIVIYNEHFSNGLCLDEIDREYYFDSKELGEIGLYLYYVVSKIWDILDDLRNQSLKDAAKILKIDSVPNIFDKYR